MRSHLEKIMRLIATLLFELGNHSWIHAKMATVDNTNAALTLDMLAAIGLPVIQWDALSDWNGGNSTPEKSVPHAIKSVRPGSILLIKDAAVPKNTQMVVPLLTAALKKQDYRCVTISDLLQTGPVEAIQDDYLEKPENNLRYDTLFLGRGTLHPRPAEPKSP